MSRQTSAAIKSALADDALRIAQGLQRRESVRRDKYTAVSTFTERECLIVKLVGLGLDDQAIADYVGITKGTVHIYLQRIHDKAAISSRARLAVAAYVATDGAGAI